MGRCLALLPILNVELAVSPPFFTECADKKLVSELVAAQFHALRNLPEFGLMSKMCMASLLYHSRWIVDNLKSNHVVRTTSVYYRQADDLKTIDEEKWVQITFPWSSPELVFSGIPPYCSLLQHIAEVRSEQKGMFLLYFTIFQI